MEKTDAVKSRGRDRDDFGNEQQWVEGAVDEMTSEVLEDSLRGIDNRETVRMALTQLQDQLFWYRKELEKKDKLLTAFKSDSSGKLTRNSGVC